jgi:hypothetical protein
MDISRYFTHEELREFLRKVVKSLLNEKLKEKTISPTILTHKEFIDTHIKKILNKIKERLEKKFNLNEEEAKTLAKEIFKYDLLNDKIIYKTIAEYILDLIETNSILLNTFISDLREIYNTPQGKIKYPIFYPFDNTKYTSPIPIIKQLLFRYETAHKRLSILEQEYKKLKQEIEKAKFLISDIKLAIKRIKESILPHLKKIYDQNEYNQRLFIFSMQQKRFKFLLEENTKKVQEYEKKLVSIKKNLEGFKEKYKEDLILKEKLINEIAMNLAKPKKRIA